MLSSPSQVLCEQAYEISDQLALRITRNRLICVLLGDVIIWFVGSDFDGFDASGSNPSLEYLYLWVEHGLF